MNMAVEPETEFTNWPRAKRSNAGYATAKDCPYKTLIIGFPNTAKNNSIGAVAQKMSFADFELMGS